MGDSARMSNDADHERASGQQQFFTAKYAKDAKKLAIVSSSRPSRTWR
jgi:hypothetical protein